MDGGPPYPEEGGVPVQGVLPEEMSRFLEEHELSLRDFKYCFFNVTEAEAHGEVVAEEWSKMQQDRAHIRPEAKLWEVLSTTRRKNPRLFGSRPFRLKNINVVGISQPSRRTAQKFWKGIRPREEPRPEELDQQEDPIRLVHRPLGAEALEP
jgi:hypothetical protein